MFVIESKSNMVIFSSHHILLHHVPLEVAQHLVIIMVINIFTL